MGDEQSGILALFYYKVLFEQYGGRHITLFSDYIFLL